MKHGLNVSYENQLQAAEMTVLPLIVAVTHKDKLQNENSSSIGREQRKHTG